MENLPESPKYDAKHWATINGMKNHEKVFITVMVTKQLLTKNYRTILSANTSPYKNKDGKGQINWYQMAQITFSFVFRRNVTCKCITHNTRDKHQDGLPTANQYLC